MLTTPDLEIDPGDLVENPLQVDRSGRGQGALGSAGATYTPLDGRRAVQVQAGAVDPAQTDFTPDGDLEVGAPGQVASLSILEVELALFDGEHLGPAVKHLDATGVRTPG